MLRNVIISAVVAFVPLLPAQAAAYNEADTITVQGAVDLMNGLNAVAAGHPCESAPTTNCQYHLSGPTIAAIARDLDALGTVIRSAQEASKAISADVLGPDNKSTGGTPEQRAAIDAKVKELMESRQPFAVPSKIKMEDLHLGDDPKTQNAIPPNVIVALRPVIADFDAR